MAKEVSCEISIILDAREKGPREVTNEEAKIVEELEASLRELEVQERRILGKFIHQGGRKSSPGADSFLVARTWAPLYKEYRWECLCGRGHR